MVQSQYVSRIIIYMSISVCLSIHSYVKYIQFENDNDSSFHFIIQARNEEQIPRFYSSLSHHFISSHNTQMLRKCPFHTNMTSRVLVMCSSWRQDHVPPSATQSPSSGFVSGPYHGRTWDKHINTLTFLPSQYYSDINKVNNNKLFCVSSLQSF